MPSDRIQPGSDQQDSFAAAQAQLASAKANLELAKLNLSYTMVFALVDGYVTNMNTSPGTYVTAGVQLMALVDTNSYWVAGHFKETQLPHIKLGQKAIITIMGTFKTRALKLKTWNSIRAGSVAIGIYDHCDLIIRFLLSPILPYNDT